MTHETDQLAINSVLREHRFESHAPVFGPVITRLRSAWYGVAARWGDQAIISQQMAYNQAATQRMAGLNQRLTELDQRVIQADHDLTNLTRTVAELTQQVIELRRMFEHS
jgi:hypothetical protein